MILLMAGMQYGIKLQKLFIGNAMKLNEYH